MEIASTNKYSIRINQEKNRLYLEIKGFWQSKADVPSYLTDLKYAASYLRSGFTCLTDMTTMKTPGAEAAVLFELGSQMLIRNGVTRSAGIFSHDVIAKMAAEHKVSSFNMDRKAFGKVTEAEQWLDS